MSAVRDAVSSRNFRGFTLQCSNGDTVNVRVHTRAPSTSTIVDEDIIEINSSSDSDSSDEGSVCMIDFNSTSLEPIDLGKLSGVSSRYFEVGEKVLATDTSDTFTWIEAEIISIMKDPIGWYKVKHRKFGNTIPKEDGLFYRVRYDNGTEPPFALRISDICPKGRLCEVTELCVGDNVMVNFNKMCFSKYNYWRQCVITHVEPTKEYAVADVAFKAGYKKIVAKGLRITSENSIMPIIKEKTVDTAISQGRSVNINVDGGTKKKSTADVPVLNRIYCFACNDKLMNGCDWCSCQSCHKKTIPSTSVMCSSCRKPYHIECLNKRARDALEASAGKWYCVRCDHLRSENAEDTVVASKRLKLTTNARSKCVVNQHGPIPGIEVGTTWLYRSQVSKAGVHRPPIGGIHGRSDGPAYSIVLSGSFCDDHDNGNEFYYTGSGGRQGTSSSSVVNCDQALTLCNKSLALSCNAPFDDLIGGEADDWRGGSPVRVIRNYKLSKSSPYAPREGNRYDGIYKVVKYFPQINDNGFLVWRYVLRRDDPVPAPWTPEGKKRIEDLGLQLIYPESGDRPKKNASRKIKQEMSDTTLETDQSPQVKVEIDTVLKTALLPFSLDNEVLAMIELDVVNKDAWDECKRVIPFGRPVFFSTVSATFKCVVCKELVYKPISTSCFHNVCLSCLASRFEEGNATCPVCMTELDGQSFSANVNYNLQNILSVFYPGYNVFR